MAGDPVPGQPGHDVTAVWSLELVAALPIPSSLFINTRISRRVTIVTQCHNCDALCHNCDILFVKMLELGSEIIPKN